MSSTWWWLSCPSKMRIWGRSSPIFFKNTFSNHRRDMPFKEKCSCLNKDALKCPKHFVSEGKQTICKEWWNVIYNVYLFCPPRIRHADKRPKGGIFCVPGFKCLLRFAFCDEVRRHHYTCCIATCQNCDVLSIPRFRMNVFCACSGLCKLKKKVFFIHFVIFLLSKCHIFIILAFIRYFIISWV